MTQLNLSLRRSAGDGLAMPFPLARRKAERAGRRQLRRLSVAPADLLRASRWLEEQALLDQLRKRARQQACGGGRMSKRAMSEYVGKPEGQRVARVIAQLSERIAAQEALLCG